MQARTPSDELEADKRSQAWSRDDEPKEECDEVPRAPLSLEVSSFPYHYHPLSELF
jgi:hypothetical protein